MENIAALAFFLGGSIAIVFLVLGLLKRKKGDTLQAKLYFKKAMLPMSISIAGFIIFGLVAEPVTDTTGGQDVVESKEREQEETKEVKAVSEEVLKDEIKKDTPKKVEVEKEESPKKTKSEETLVKEESKEEVTPPVESTTLIEVEPSQEIEKLAKQIINDDLKNTTINKIDVNEHMGRNDGTYLVLPHLKWNVKNSAKTTMETLEMYSDHLAAKLADDKNVSEITVFWEVPYHSEGNNVAKFMYERYGDGMAKVDKWSVLQ